MHRRKRGRKKKGNTLQEVDCDRKTYIWRKEGGEEKRLRQNCDRGRNKQREETKMAEKINGKLCPRQNDRYEKEGKTEGKKGVTRGKDKKRASVTCAEKKRERASIKNKQWTLE